MVSLAQFFKCLSEDTRLYATLLIHKEGELCVCELMEALEESQPKISRHLAQLRNCDILIDDRRGQWVYYKLDSALPQWALNILDQCCDANRELLNEYKKKLSKISNRPSCC